MTVHPPHGEVDLTSLPQPGGGQHRCLSNSVGQETEASSSGQRPADAQLPRQSQTLPRLGTSGVAGSRGGAGRRRCPQKPLQAALGARVSPDHGDVPSRHTGLGREGRALLRGTLGLDRRTVCSCSATRPILTGTHPWIRLETRVRFYEPWWPRSSFLFPSFIILLFPLFCPEVSGVAAVRAALWWAASPPAREPRPLPARFSVWTEGGGEGGPLSPSSCPAPFGLHGKAPKPLPEVSPPGKALSGKGTQAPSRGEGPTWGSLWQQLGLHSVPFPASQDKPGSVPVGGALLTPCNSSKGQ